MGANVWGPRTDLAVYEDRLFGGMEQLIPASLPPYNPFLVKGLPISMFEAEELYGGTWAVYSGNGTVADETGEPYVGLGGQAKKLFTDGDSNASIESTLTTNFKMNLATYPQMECLMHVDNVANVGAGLQTYMWSDVAGGDYYVNPAIVPRYTGWNVLRWQVKGTGYTYAGDFDDDSWTTPGIEKIRLRMFKDVSDVTVRLASFRAVKPMPIFLLESDDGNTTNTTLMPLVEKYGFRMTLNLICNDIETGESTALTKDELNSAYELGHEFSVHTWDDNDWAALSQANVQTQIRKAANWLIHHGWSRGVRYVATPGGVNNATIRAAAAAEGRTDAIRSGGTGSSVYPSMADGVSISGEFAGNNYMSVNNVTWPDFATAQTFIDGVITAGEKTSLTWHIIGDAAGATTASATLTDQILSYLREQVDAGNCLVMRASDYRYSGDQWGALPGFAHRLAPNRDGETQDYVRHG